MKKPSQYYSLLSLILISKGHCHSDLNHFKEITNREGLVLSFSCSSDSHIVWWEAKQWLSNRNAAAQETAV